MWATRPFSSSRGVLLQSEKFEVVGVFEELVRKGGLRRRKQPLKVRDGFALPLEETALDLVNEDIETPAVLDRVSGIPETQFSAGQLLQECDVMRPGQFRKCLSQSRFFLPCLGEGPHILEVPWTEPLHAGELAPKVGSKPLDHLGSPTLGLLRRKDAAADVPIKEHELAIGGDDCAHLSGADSVFELL
jgi:hypothetical protein